MSLREAFMTFLVRQDPPDWTWNVKAGRYQDRATGRFLARETVIAHTESSIQASGVVTDQLASLAAQDAISSGDWYILMREEVKEEYIRQYLSGIGGREVMTPSDWGSIGGMLREQYDHLDGFALDIAEGELTEAQIAARSRMYTNSAREGYERAVLKTAKGLGFDEELWVIGSVNPCPDCVDNASADWQPLGTFSTPGDGSTVCLTNCDCHKFYRNSQTGETY